MKRWLTLLLCALLLPLWAAADAPDKSYTLSVGQTLETGVYADQGVHKFGAKALLPVWLTLEPVQQEGSRLAILSGEAAAAGEWRFTVQVTEYAPGDKKGKALDNIDVQVIVTPDESGAAYRMDRDYRGDGQYMLTVTESTPVYRLPGAGEMDVVPAGTRMIACNDFFAQPEVIWCAAYSRAYGYCWLPGTAVALEDKAQELLYNPGFGQTVALFTVDDPAQYRVEVEKADKEQECSVATLTRITALPQESGQYLLVGHFSLEENVCKVTREMLQATLYDLDGQPVEVHPFVFDLPKWY